MILPCNRFLYKVTESLSSGVITLPEGFMYKRMEKDAKEIFLLTPKGSYRVDVQRSLTNQIELYGSGMNWFRNKFKLVAGDYLEFEVRELNNFTVRIYDALGMQKWTRYGGIWGHPRFRVPLTQGNGRGLFVNFDFNGCIYKEAFDMAFLKTYTYACFVDVICAKSHGILLYGENWQNFIEETNLLPDCQIVFKYRNVAAFDLYLYDVDGFQIPFVHEISSSDDEHAPTENNAMIIDDDDDDEVQADENGGNQFEVFFRTHICKKGRLVIPRHFARSHRLEEMGFVRLLTAAGEFTMELVEYPDEKPESTSQLNLAMVGNWKYFQRANRIRFRTLCKFVLDTERTGTENAKVAYMNVHFDG